MHEVALCEAILDAVEKRAAGRRVTALRVAVGALHRVPPEAFDQAFEVLSAGSVAQGADVDLVVLPLRVRCRGCDWASHADDLLGSCPACGGRDVMSEGGDELVLDMIRVAGSAGDISSDEPSVTGGN